MLTKDFMHNLHFDTTEFVAEKWKKRNLLIRQICHDSPAPDTYFLLDADNLDLFIYFEQFGTRENPRIIKIGKLPKQYIRAVGTVAVVELAMLPIIHKCHPDTLKTIKKLSDFPSGFVFPIF